jgi:sialate O-acetylesterase
MTRIKLIAPILTFFILMTLQEGIAQIKLPHLFGDHMVLQREDGAKIWGWASKGEKVSLLLKNKTYKAVTDESGKWQIDLGAHPAGGPFDIVILGKNEVKLEYVYFGDVWVCSGQSNMQWTLQQTNFQEEDTAYVSDAPVRLFTVKIGTDYLPKEDVEDGQWQQMNSDNIQHFSAVSYHFGKFLHKKTNVPIGLISSNLGATAVETWMPNESLLPFEQFRGEIAPVIKRGKDFAALEADFKTIKKDWEKTHYLKGIGIENNWQDPATNTADWQPFQVPGLWEEQGMEGHDGAVWFRKEFDLPEDFSQDSFLLQLSQLDDYDIAWVNGVKIGETYGRHNHRNYFIKKENLRPKGNVLVLRVFDIGGNGGFSTNAFWMSPLVRGEWKCKKGIAIDSADFPKVEMPNVTPFSSPAVLYNANIAPLTSLSIKGAIWYQGEANAARAYEYRDLFPAMIEAWRGQWKQEDFPFLFVQLANYTAELDTPADSDWAELREAQAMALSLPNTGMACAIDIGEANDIHPKNKEDVGKRLGQSALHTAYDMDEVHSGPVFKSIEIQGQEAIVHFDHVGKGLMTKNKHGYVHGFEVAGEDSQFYWAKAAIEGNTVRVFTDKIKRIKAIRYAWSNNPGTIDLYNKEGLPVVPFRTDDWDGATKGELFDAEAARF